MCAHGIVVDPSTSVLRSGLTLGGMIGALFMAALQINKDPDNDPWLH
jgi:hypothetical protein